MATPITSLDWATLGFQGGGWVGGVEYDKRACYQRALELDPKHSTAWSNLGLEGGGAVDGQYYNAFTCYFTALQLDPKNSVAWLGLGNLCYQDGGDAVVDVMGCDARACYLRALELDPKYPMAWHGLGWQGGGRVGGVEYDTRACYQRALELDPKNSCTWNSLGWEGGGKVLGRLYTAQECRDVARDPARWLEFGAPEQTAAPTGPGRPRPQRGLPGGLRAHRRRDEVPASVRGGHGDQHGRGGHGRLRLRGRRGRSEARARLHGLDKDEAGALYLNTADPSMYRELNTRLRLRDRERLKCFLPLLKLMMQARNKLPVYVRTVYRGVDQNLKGKFQQGQKFYWWSFTSTTKLMSVTQEFLGSQGQTLFAIEASSGRDISAYSAIDGENEVLLFPGTKLKVLCVMDRANVHIAQLQEMAVKVELLR